MRSEFTKQKRKTKNPCPGCGMGGELCFCPHIPQLKTRTRLSLIIHVRESRKPTNTGLLALQALENSDLRIRGEIGGGADLEGLINPDYHPLLLFPSEGSQPLNKEFVSSLDRPIQLIVPDGNWRQASRVANRYPELREVTRVMVCEKNTETHFLRRESTEYGMATLQAIAYAMAHLEDAVTGRALMKLYQLKLEQTLRARGVKKNPSSSQRI